jgi:hypothetical protein
VADLDDVRRIVESLPSSTFERSELDAVGASVEGKAFAFTWNQRVDPKKPRVLRPDVLAVRVDGRVAKQELLDADPEKFFTESHYNGYPAVLVRLAEVGEDELRELLTDAWRTKAPKRLVKESGL